MPKKFETGLREKHLLPYGFGHVAIVADLFGDGSPMFSVEIFDARTKNVERVRLFDRLRKAQAAVMNIHAGASYLLHLQHHKLDA